MKIYLATPYSHPDPKVREWRFENINSFAADLMKCGHVVFSPISHSHPISQHLGNSLDSEFYLGQDIPFMNWADKMIIARFLNDPDPCATYDSYGLNWEIEYMLCNGKETTCVDKWGDCEI